MSDTAPELRYKLVLLKLSGEALAGDRGFGIDPSVVDQLTDEIQSIVEMGVTLGVVIGGGNIVRGAMASKEGMDRVQADYMGMLSTIINALAVQDLLEHKGVETRVMTAIRMEEIAEPYIRRRALRHMEKERVVLFAGGVYSGPREEPRRRVHPEHHVPRDRESRTRCDGCRGGFAVQGERPSDHRAQPGESRRGR